MRNVRLIGLVVVGLAVGAPALAQGLGPSAPAVPTVGVAPRGLLSGLLDSGRFHVSNTLMFSTTSGGGPYGGSRSMNFTTLTYEAGPSLAASVTVGNRLFGNPRYPGDKGSMQLESLLVKYRPISNLSVTIGMNSPGLALLPDYRY